MTDKTMNFREALINGSAGRHETFTPRYGWLKRGYDRCSVNAHVFNDENAIEQLGVGKNMVRSIRYWCILFRLLEDDVKPGCLKPSDFGNRLLDTEKGWDPYLEDPASLWLLHWQIFRPPFIAVTWNIAFSYITLQTYTTRELTNAIHTKAKEIGKICDIAIGSWEKDVSCILRMYTFEKREQTEIRCPFTDLELIIPAIESPDKDRYHYSYETKRNLPDLVFLAAVFDYAAQWYSGQSSLSLVQIAYGPMSPGMAFRLTESECGQRLDRVCRQFKKATFTETNGVRQVQFTEKPYELYEECLMKYYGGNK